MEPDRLAAYLADARMQAEDHGLSPASEVLPMIAALERALALTDEWEKAAAMAFEREEHAAATGLPGTAARMSGRRHAQEDCVKALRVAISAELLGEEAGSG